MKNQTNIVEHAVNKISRVLEKAITNLFGSYDKVSSKKSKSKGGDANLDIIDPPKILSTTKSSESKIPYS